MANLFTFFAFISNFVCFISAVFSRIFVSQVRSIPKTDIEAGAPGAIEAGAPTATDGKVKTSPACAHWYKHDLESGLLCSKSLADFVDMEYEAIPFGSPIRGAGSSAEGPKADVSGSPARSSASSADSCSDDSISQLPAVLRSERRVKKRGSLFDLISQFPDVPRHLPLRPNGLSTCSSPATSSGESQSADDTPDTSAPGSPEAQVDDFFGVRPEAPPLSQGKDNMAGFRFGGVSRRRNRLAESLRWSQFDDTEVGFDTLLAQRDGSESFVCEWTSRRPGSLVWFADASLNLPGTSQVAILCIVKKGKGKAAEVEDEVVVCELMRWEESRRLGLKALREAKGHGFFGLASRKP